MPAPLTTNVAPPQKQWLYFLFYDAPTVLWLLFALSLATSLGSYDMSVTVLYTGFAFLSPTDTPPNIDGMYALVHIFRRGAYFVVYGGFAVLLIRAVQRGATRLRRRTAVAVCGGGTVFALLDNAVRNVSPNRHGGLNDLLISLAVIVTGTGFAWLFFATKNWERATFADAPENDSPTLAVE